MNTPGKHTNTGRVLRAMIGAGPLTAGEIRKRVYRYQIARLPRKIREELNRESSKAWMSGEAA